MTNVKLNLEILEPTFAVVRFDGTAEIPKWALNEDFISITRTFDELSIVCREELVPTDMLAQKNFKALKVEGVLDFSLTGILAGISDVLKKSEISIFVISTYDTDYIMVDKGNLEKACDSLKQAGYGVL